MPANTSKGKLPHIRRKWYRSGAIANARILTFSDEQLFWAVNTMEKWDEGSIYTKMFYDGREFTDNRQANISTSTWEDVREVFVGVIDPSKITYEDVSQYDLYYTLRYFREREQEQQEDEDAIEFMMLQELDEEERMFAGIW